MNNGDNFTKMDQDPYNRPPVQPKSGSAFGISGFILSLLSLLTCCFFYLGIPLSIIGICLSLVSKKRESNQLATAGLIIGIIGLILSAIMGIFELIVLLFPELVEMIPGYTTTLPFS